MEIWIPIVSGVILLISILGIRIVRPVEEGLIETMGKYTRTGRQGFQWIIPLIQRMIKVNITEIRVDIKKQEVITKDKLNASVDGVVYYKIKDTTKAIYSVNNFALSIPSLARTTLRAVIGDMSLSDANEKRILINRKIAEQMDTQVGAWGIDIIRVELQEISPPEDVQIAMNEVVTAENKKTSAVNFANAVEVKADGERRAVIKEADGNKQARILVAEGQAKAFDLVNKSFTGNAQILKKLETTEKSLANNTKIVVPSDTQLVNVIGDLGGVVPIKVGDSKSKVRIK